MNNSNNPMTRESLSRRELKSWCDTHVHRHNDWFFIIVSKYFVQKAMSLDGMTFEFWDGDKHHELDRHPKSKVDYKKSEAEDFMVYWRFGDSRFFIQPVNFTEE